MALPRYLLSNVVKVCEQWHYQGVIDNSYTGYWLFLLFPKTRSYCYQIYVYSILKTCSHEHILDIFVYLSAVTALEL